MENLQAQQRPTNRPSRCTSLYMKREQFEEVFYREALEVSFNKLNDTMDEWNKFVEEWNESNASQEIQEGIEMLCQVKKEGINVEDLFDDEELFADEDSSDDEVLQMRKGIIGALKQLFADEDSSDDEELFDDEDSSEDEDSSYDEDFSAAWRDACSGEQPYTISAKTLKEYLLRCDEVRANIQPYDERLLSDVNRGHWELFESPDDGDEYAEVQFPADEMAYARPPQLDVRLNGTCAIDFGTKSTVVVCRDGEERMLRVGKGDYAKAPTMRDFENPTVVELRDIEGFLAAYRGRAGRPFTKWNQVTVSHQAADAIFRDQETCASVVYNSVFSELKQWAREEDRWPILIDREGNMREIQPYAETSDMDDGEGGGDFDPIELYAYYLGLYINNMHHQIYLDYILSFPVNYKKAVRERIRASFERGLKKSLPPALLKDEPMMRRFRVYLGASEPAAYAISALEGFGLEPKSVGEKVAYGVFDFGGGTTDFDFGIEYVPENGRRNFIIEQFGFNGDELLGGENILELLAYEVYKKNLPVMREQKIPFALPAGCDIFAGAEMLVQRTGDASAHMNRRILAEKLRPLWESDDEGIEKLTGDALNVTLFSSVTNTESGSSKVGVDLHVDVEMLRQVIERRIRQGVENFFQSLLHAFKGKSLCLPIHIFLAGNSCRSPVVKTLFEQYIAKEEKKIAEMMLKNGQVKDAKGAFCLHEPLGLKEEAKEGEGKAKAASLSMDFDRKRTGKTGVISGQKIGGIIAEMMRKNGQMKDAKGAFCLHEPLGLKEEAKEGEGKAEGKAKAASLSMDFDRKRTGKTGVAFGLLRCRKGGKDVKIINGNVDDTGEVRFPYYLGNAGKLGKYFTVCIGKGVEYGDWAYFTFADEPEFELYYTSEPRALQDDMPIGQVQMVHCLIDEADVCDEDDVGIYIRKTAPNMIEYAVGRKEEFQTEFSGKIYSQSL